MTDPTNYASIGWLMLGLAAIVTALNQGFAFWKNLNGGSERRQIQSPLDVRAVSEFVKEKDCVARHSSVETRISVLEERRVADVRDASTSRKAIYDEIRKVHGEVSGKMDSVRRELSVEIQGMPMQIIAILKNTNAIK